MGGYRHTSFGCDSLTALWRYYIFYKLKVCGNPASSKSICTIFPTTLFTACLSITFWLHLFVQSLSHVWLFVTPWTAAHQASLSLTISQSLPKFMSIELLMPFSHLLLCHRLLLQPSIFPSTGVFSNELAVHIRWPKYWSFSISPFNEYSGLISFRIYWFDLLEVQWTLKSPVWFWVGSNWSCMFSRILIVSPCTHFLFLGTRVVRFKESVGSFHRNILSE